MKLGQKGESLIKYYESCRLKAYQDGGGVWTIGYGNTSYEDGRKVKEGDNIPQWRADELFARIAIRITFRVSDLIKGIDINQDQFDALVDFTWNLGINALAGSTLLKKIKVNTKNFGDIDSEFSKWNHDNGKTVTGLTYRRLSESLLYRTGELRFFN